MTADDETIIMVMMDTTSTEQYSDLDIVQFVMIQRSWWTSHLVRKADDRVPERVMKDQLASHEGWVTADTKARYIFFKDILQSRLKTDKLFLSNYYCTCI